MRKAVMAAIVAAALIFGTGLYAFQGTAKPATKPAKEKVATAPKTEAKMDMKEAKTKMKGAKATKSEAGSATMAPKTKKAHKTAKVKTEPK